MGHFEVADPKYEALYARTLDVLRADSRVHEVRLSGSLADGSADRWSDLDVAIIAHPDHHASFLADWPVWLRSITPTVFARTPLAPFIINAVTSDGLTFDLAVWSGAAFEPPPSSQYVVGALSSVRFDNVGDALEYAVAEQLRGLAGPFVSLVQRGEHVRHMTGVPHLLGLLTTVFLAESGQPQPGKRWNHALTPEQREAIANLPAVRATREDVMAFGLATAELVVRRARPMFDRFGLAWPHELAAVAADRLRAELGLETTAWLY